MTTRRQFLLAGALGALSVRHAAAQARPPRVGKALGIKIPYSVLARATKVIE